MRPDPPHSLPGAYRLPWQDRLPGPLTRLVTVRWWHFAVALVAGFLLADQINAPSSRVIKALAGAALFILAYRAKPFYSLCFITLFFMFPFSIFIGSSTLIFAVLLALIYLARLTMRQVPPLRRTPVDIPMAMLATCYLLSFYNIEKPEALSESVRLVVSYLSTWLLFYETANFIRTEAQLRTFVKILMVSVSLAIFVGMWEWVFPGRTLVPGWVLFWSAKFSASAGYRLRGPFDDFELYAEFMAIMFFVTFFFYRRTTQPHHRFIAGTISLLSLVILLGTVTRGATLAIMGGVVYLTWCLRKKLKPRDLISTAGIAIFVFAIMEFVVSHFTSSGSVITRLLGTKFVNGVPDSRVGWGAVWNHVLEHPIIGHGAYYDLGLSESLRGKGLYTAMWPHCQYLLYAHTTGFLGAGAFLWLTITLLRLSHRTKANGLQDPNYPRALMLVLHVMLLVFLVDELKIDYLRNPSYMYFPWILMGLIVATYRVIQQKEEAGPPAAADPETAG